MYLSPKKSHGFWILCIQRKPSVFGGPDIKTGQSDAGVVEACGGQNAWALQLYRNLKVGSLCCQTGWNRGNVPFSSLTDESGFLFLEEL